MKPDFDLDDMRDKIYADAEFLKEVDEQKKKTATRESKKSLVS